MFDDLGFDNLLDESADCYECESDARYCYLHRNEREITRRAVEGWAKLKAQRERIEMDDIRTTRLATLNNIADSLDEISAKTNRLIAAAEYNDEKLAELRARVWNASSYACFCWSEEARNAEGM